MSMKNFRIAAWTTLVVASLAAVASLLIPVPAGEDSTNFYVSLMPAVATPLLYIGGSVVLFMGFGAFTNKLRRPYVIISIGLTVWGLSYLLLPLLVITNQINNNYVLAVAALGSTGTALLTFIGIRMLAKLFTIEALAGKWWFVIVTILVVSALIAVAPHAPYDAPELESDTANVMIMLPNIFFLIGGYLVLLIKRRASVAFTNALAWLYLSMFFTAVLAFGGSTIASLALGSAGNHIVNAVAIFPSCVAAALFLRSAYSFNKITESADVEGLSVARNFFGKPLKPRGQEDTTSVDIVTYVAGLASNPLEIDSLVDPVRRVTSNMQSGQKVSQADQQTLMDAYLKIEEYLVTKESLRVFTRDNLRQDIAQKLRLTAGSTGTFWPNLSRPNSATPSA